jgi:hypothetical protein
MVISMNNCKLEGSGRGDCDVPASTARRYEISGSSDFEMADLWASVIQFRYTVEHVQVGKLWKADTCNEP